MAIQPVILEYETNPTGDDWAEITGAVKLKSLRMGGVADAGSPGSGYGFDFEDLAAAFFIPARRRVRLWLIEVGGVLIASGRVTGKGVGRRSPPVGDARGFDVQITDRNQDLQGIEVHNWIRPAETDVQRLTALADEFLSGDPRVSTNLTQAYLSSSNPVDLPKKTYDATNPAGVVADVCQQTGKLFFVNQWGDISYDARDSTAISDDIGLDLTIADNEAQVTTGSTLVFNPIWSSGTPGQQDGAELYTGLTTVYGEGNYTQSDSDAGAEAAHDYWRETIYTDAKADAEAIAELDTILDQRKAEENRYNISILVPDDPTGLMGFGFSYGHTFTFRAAAAGVLSPIVLRAAQVTWSPVRPGLWRCDIIAGFPRKLAPRLGRGAPPTNPPVPFDGNNGYTVCHPTSFFLGTWTDQTDPVLADLLIPSVGDGTSIVIGPATGSTTATPGWEGGSLYGIAEPAGFPVSPLGVGVLSGRIVVPAHADFTGVGPAILTIAATNPGGAFGLELAITNSENLPALELEQNQAYFFKIRFDNGSVSWKVWRVLSSEPGSYSGSDSLTGNIVTKIGASVDWTDVSGPTAPGAFVVDQLQWCYDAEYGRAYAGGQYGPVFIAVADGMTSTFTLPAYPGGGYAPGTLVAYVDGIWQPVEETNPLTGEFDLGWEPAEGDVITASWRVPR